MTLTETRPPDATDSAAAPAVERGVAAVFATGDHKRLGLLFALAGIVALVAACVTAALAQLPALGDAADFIVRPGSRLAAATATLAFVVGIPALWIGLATYVVPLQVGAHRLAMPRLHALALWSFVGGALLIAAGYIAGDTRLNSLGASIPPLASPGQRAADATLLVLAGLAIVAVGTLLAAATIFVTIMNRRGAGVRLLDIPAFAWSALATSLVLVLSTPVFLAGLVLLYLDQRYGGAVFSGGIAGLRIWQHELWLLGRPEALVFAGAGVGIYCDIVATSLRRPLLGWPVARAASAAAPLVALLAWIGATSVLLSPFAPIATIGTAVFLLPPVLAVLTWAGSVRGAKGARLLPAMVPNVAHLLVVGLVLTFVAIAVLVEVEGARATYYRNGQATLVSLALPVLALAAGVLHWGPKLRGRVPTLATGGAVGLLLLGGTVLMALPGHLIGLEASDSVVVIGVAGAALTILGLLALLPFVIGPAGSATSDPYEGLTLEWVAASPPVRHNFDVLPEVGSPYPLYDARTGSGDTTEDRG